MPLVFLGIERLRNVEFWMSIGWTGTGPTFSRVSCSENRFIMRREFYVFRINLELIN